MGKVGLDKKYLLSTIKTFHNFNYYKIHLKKHFRLLTVILCYLTKLLTLNKNFTLKRQENLFLK